MLCVFSVYLFAKLFEHPSYSDTWINFTLSGRRHRSINNLWKDPSFSSQSPAILAFCGSCNNNNVIISQFIFRLKKFTIIRLNYHDFDPFLLKKCFQIFNLFVKAISAIINPFNIFCQIYVRYVFL